MFTAKFWASLCFYFKVRRRLSTAFHPQTDGQTERQNQTLEQYLRSYVNYQQDDWVRLLPLAEFAYNNSRHTSTGYSPFYAHAGYNPRLDVADRVPDREIPAVDARIDEIRAVRAQLEKRCVEAAKTQAMYHDKKITPRRYAVGDRVWLSGKNIRTVRPSKKLDYKFHGPYEITEVVGKQAYRLALPETAPAVHPVFHVSLLEPATQANDEPPQAEPLVVDDQEEWEVEEVLDSRMRRNKLQYLVKWVGFSDASNQWLSAADLANAPEKTDEFHQRYPHKPGRRRHPIQ